MRKAPEPRLNGKLRQDEAYVSQRLNESKAREEEIRLRTAKTRGDLLSRKEVLDLRARQIRAAATKFLNVRRRIEALHPDTPKEVLDDIEALHREALEELSTGD